MGTANLRQAESSAPGALCVAFELSTKEWRVAYTTGLGERIGVTALPAGDRERLRTVVAAAKRQHGLPDTAVVRSCYEAGRDGWWPHRLLAAEGLRNVVVDSASIEVSRRARRTKTDRLDARKLVTMLVRWQLGDERVWKIVPVPSVETEALRQRPRMRATLQKERTRWRNRIHAALATVGVRLRVTATFPAQLEQVRQWDGTPVPPAVQERVGMAWRLLQQIEAERRQIAQALRTARRRRSRRPPRRWPR